MNELCLKKLNLKNLTDNELSNINGGALPILAIIAGGIGLYDIGKRIGEFIYWSTHKS